MVALGRPSGCVKRYAAGSPLYSAGQNGVDAKRGAAGHQPRAAARASAPVARWHDGAAPAGPAQQAAGPAQAPCGALWTAHRPLAQAFDVATWRCDECMWRSAHGGVHMAATMAARANQGADDVRPAWTWTWRPNYRMKIAGPQSPHLPFCAYCSGNRPLGCAVSWTRLVMGCIRKFAHYIVAHFGHRATLAASASGCEAEPLCRCCCNENDPATGAAWPSVRVRMPRRAACRMRSRAESALRPHFVAASTISTPSASPANRPTIHNRPRYGCRRITT